MCLYSFLFSPFFIKKFSSLGYTGVLKIKGDCLALLGKIEEAFEQYKAALDASILQDLLVLKVLSSPSLPLSPPPLLFLALPFSLLLPFFHPLLMGCIYSFIFLLISTLTPVGYTRS
jgi:hypothetical protein